MTNEVTVEFSVERPKDVPRIGQRKLIRVNGRPTYLWCRKLRVDMVRGWSEDGTERMLWYDGEAVYGLTERTWQGASGH